MSATFDGALLSIFDRGQAAIARRVEKLNARSEALQSKDTSRMAFQLTAAIEEELTPAIDEGLAIYDAAINRPIEPNARWEQAMTRQIEFAVDAAVAQALKLDDEKHPWKPLLKEETPKLRERLIGYAEEHFEKLREERKQRGRGRPSSTTETVLRVGLFLGGLILGAVLMRVL